MPKARAWRSSGKAKKRTHAAASRSSTLSETAMPTTERFKHATNQAGMTGFEIGGDGSRRIVRMLDAPLEQLRARTQITEQQYQVLGKFRLHWFLGHQAGSLRAIDLNRVVHGMNYSGTCSEQEMLHREMVNVAGAAMAPLESLVTVQVVLEECSVNETGALIGYRSPYRGRQAVIECLHTASAKIMSAWLTMDRP